MYGLLNVLPKHVGCGIFSTAKNQLLLFLKCIGSIFNCFNGTDTRFSTPIRIVSFTHGFVCHRITDLSVPTSFTVPTLIYSLVS